MMNSQKMDSERARDAFEELRPRLDQLEELRRANVDVEKAAAQAVVIGHMVQDPEVREMFEQLSPRVFDMQHVDGLEKAALATLHTVVEHRDAAVHGSRARVPTDTLEAATTLKQDMLLVVKYHLRDEHHAAIIADIGAGHGHADLASDLLRLSKLYETHHERLAQDQSYYRHEDAATAQELAHRIYTHLGGGTESDERTWAGYVQRAWTFLLDTYDEVSTAGRWLYRKDKGEERFPSLIASQRQMARRNSNDHTEAEILAQPGDMPHDMPHDQSEADILARPAAMPQARSEADILAMPAATPAAQAGAS
jgi:hypothetical protein